ncbi:MAG: serine/threonine protein kinase [Polyangiaceae bacterium]|jgi:serine/threonine-protein kinase|nr:serine/threonine protein kinase [Polyangiaceae bacterium]
MIQQGDLLAGKYRVEQVLGAGGMGYVVAALHEQLGQRVAVKLLVPELCENEDSVTRFLREARAAVRIQSEHVARVLDVGELTNGSPYMVMEFLSGRDLADELDLPGQQLDVPTAIDYVLQASEAVAEAHSMGLIHRDLKPANLFLTHRPDGSPLVKVLDFGISKAINVDDSALEPAPSLTATHSLLGSPAYMSPEQIRRPKSVDTRTDIWSLGSILWELLTRDPPFNADSPLALLAAVVSDPLPDIREKRPDVSPELAAVINKCLEKNPDNRYQTVAELADALLPFAPRSQNSVSRISGILRSVSLRPVSADKSPSSERTLQSPGTGNPITGNPVSGDQPTEIDRVRVVTPAPAARSEKSTRTDWEATPSLVRRSRRRVVIVTAVAVSAALAGLVAWQTRPRVSFEPAPDASVPKPTGATAAVEEPTPSALASVAAPASVAPPAPSAVGPVPSVAAPAAQGHGPTKVFTKPKVVAAPSVVAPPPSALVKPKAADPLDGRR